MSVIGHPFLRPCRRLLAAFGAAVTGNTSGYAVWQTSGECYVLNNIQELLMQILQMVLFSKITEQKVSHQEHYYFADRSICALITSTRDHTCLRLCRKCWHFSSSLTGRSQITGGRSNLYWWSDKWHILIEWTSRALDKVFETPLMGGST